MTRLGKLAVATAVTPQADGKILVGGFARNGGRAGFALVRYLPNGRVDPTFVRFPAVIGPFGGVTALATQSDGKIIAIGGGSGDFLVARYLPDGRLDSAFGAGGVVRTDFGRVDGASALVIQPDGKLLVAGTSGSNVLAPSETWQFVLARYDSDGRLDETFGSEGRAAATFSGLAYALAARVASDGSITVAGAHDPDPIRSHGELALARFTSAGVADGSFGASGVSFVDFPPASYRSDERFISGMGFLPDGGLVAAGDAVVGRKDRVVMERLLPNSSPDPSLGPGGASVFGSLGLLFAVTNDPSAGVFAASAGFFGPIGDDQGLLVSKFSASGGYERDFGRGGTSAIRFRGAKAEAAAIAADEAGRVLVAGTIKKHRVKRFLLVRLGPRGHPDRGFGSRHRRKH